MWGKHICLDININNNVLRRRCSFMKARTEILSDIEYFFVDVFERQKELDLKIYAESSPKYIFKKKDYDSNIKEYKRLKELALKIDTSEYAPDEKDEDLLELVCIFEEMLALYNQYTDRGTAVQVFLKRKSEGEKILNSEYREATQRQKATAAAFSRSFNELSVAYADYLHNTDDVK